MESPTTLVGQGARVTRAADSQDSRGIAALEESRKVDVDTFARDESGFVSPTIQALIEKAPDNLKGQGIIDWARANANKGVKPKELEFLGLDEFISANPNATVREAVEGISGNRVRVSQNVRSGGEEAVDFERTVPETDPLDGSSLWEPQAEDMRYSLEQGDEFIKKDVLDHHNKQVMSNSNHLTLHEAQRFLNENHFKSYDDIPESMLDDLVEDFAKHQ
jgi:hypothetical protein